MVAQWHAPSGCVLLRTWPQHRRLPVDDPCLIGFPSLSAAERADLSWSGFILLAGTLGMLWLAYFIAISAIRVNQRRQVRS
jgi:hypothetical protein